VPSAEERFRAKTERRDGHAVWTGARDARGVGMVRIDGKLRTVQRAAWEFEHGPLPPDVRVNTCAAERACVRIDHLSLSPTTSRPPSPPRRRRRAGSLRQVRPDVWEIAVTDATTPTGRPKRRFLTIHGTRPAAERALADLAAATTRHDLGDLRIRELVGRYLETTSDDESSHRTGSQADRRLHREVITPSLGDELAALATGIDIERALEAAAADGIPPSDVRDAVRLLRRSYQWAKRRHWRNDDPTADIDTRWLAR
jgi:hypothetical protein